MISSFVGNVLIGAMALIVSLWVSMAIIRYIFQVSRTEGQSHDPYWAEDGDSENIPALRY